MRNKRTKEKESFQKDVLGFLLIIAVSFLIQKFVVINARIPSGSMENTIMPGDRIFGNRLAYEGEAPERYDIVIFRDPDEPKKLLIKRVIGLPGETLLFRNGDVYLKGSEEPLRDDFCPQPDSTVPGKFSEEVAVPEGAYLMLGDNRTNSLDARFWTNPFVYRDQILGKAGIRYWPLNKIGIF